MVVEVCKKCVCAWRELKYSTPDRMYINDIHSLFTEKWGAFEFTKVLYHLDNGQRSYNPKLSMQRE